MFVGLELDLDLDLDLVLVLDLVFSSRRELSQY